MTDIEKTVIDTLVHAGRSSDHWGEPIHQVDAKMHWASKETRAFVEQLERRKLIVARTEAIDPGESPGRLPDWWWERPSTEDLERPTYTARRSHRQSGPRCGSEVLPPAA
jgi:hypothetical protein